MIKDMHGTTTAETRPAPTRRCTAKATQSGAAGLEAGTVGGRAARLDGRAKSGADRGRGGARALHDSGMVWAVPQRRRATAAGRRARGEPRRKGAAHRGGAGAVGSRAGQGRLAHRAANRAMAGQGARDHRGLADDLQMAGKSRRAAAGSAPKPPQKGSRRR